MNKIAFYIFFTSIFSTAFGQQNIDKIIAIIGGQIILQTDLEKARDQYLLQNEITEDLNCIVFESILMDKLLLHTAEVDSMSIPENQIEAEVNRRLIYFVDQIGSEKKMESYFKKTSDEIREDLYKMIKNQQLLHLLQNKITDKIKINTSEVQAFYELHQDSLPEIQRQLEVAQLVVGIKYSKTAVDAAKNKLQQLRERILAGEDFGKLAVLYSEDPGSAKKKGEIGFSAYTNLVPEYAAVAFRMKVGEVSAVIRSPFGFHLIKLIEKKGNKVRTAHILAKIEFNTDDLIAAEQKIDSIYQLLNQNKLSFEAAVSLFSEDNASKNNAGRITNPKTGQTIFDLDDMDASIFSQIKNLKKGELSKPHLFRDALGQQSLRILQLKTDIPSHAMNLKDDYGQISQMLLNKKKSDFFMTWLKQKLNQVYLKVLDEELQKCPIADRK